MADGNHQQSGFNFPRPRLSLLRPGEIVVDLFAGGGGASEALKQALGRDPDIAINHDALAIGMHAANHPLTRHMREDVWQADPIAETRGQPVGWFHASPDCTHFSQAKGGQPRDRATRSLAWVIPKWCGKLKRVGRPPRMGSMENVMQMLKWGPLVAKRCKITGRVVRLDGTVAAKGERVPLQQQFLVPDKRREGQTWRQFVRVMNGLGYVLEWRKLKASDYGAGTSRERLFAVFRRDGEPIRWPAPTHGKAPGLKPLVTAADCLDWSVPCPSIFDRKKPLADATQRRIAKGIRRYVLDAAEPFIVGCGGRAAQTAERPVSEPLNTITSKADACVCSATLAPFVSPLTHHGERRQHPVDEPLPTITAAHRGELAAVVPTLAPFITEHANASTQRNHAVDEPLRTQCAQVKGGHFAIVAPTLVQAAHGEGSGASKRRGSGAHNVQEPIGTIHAGGGSFAVAAAHLIKFRGDSKGAPADEPMPTITSGAGAKRPAGAAHAMGIITAFLEQANGGYYQGDGNDVRDPVTTITGSGSQQRLAAASLVTMRRNATGQHPEDPLGTVCAHTVHHAVVECTLSPEHEAGALRVAAFLMRYHGTGGQHAAVDDPLTTITTKDRLALVTVTIQGQPYVIVDIGLRMLRREELFRAQGFPAGYIIDRTADGKPLSISASVRMAGNSVPPPPLYALARANLDTAGIDHREAA